MNTQTTVHIWPVCHDVHVCVCVTFQFNYKKVPATPRRTGFLEFTMSPVSLIKNEKNVTPALHDGNTERRVGNELL